MSTTRKTWIASASALLFVAAGLLLYGTRADQTQAAPGTLEAILAGIEGRQRLITSLSGAFTLTKQFANAHPNPGMAATLAEVDKFNANKTAIRWAFSDGQWREEWQDFDGPREHRIVAFDGQTGYHYEPQKEFAWETTASRVPGSAIESEFGYYLDVSQDYFPNAVRWSSALRSRSALVAGIEQLGDVDCYRLEAPPDEFGVTHRWWFAPDFEYLLMKYETRREKPERVPSQAWDPVKQMVNTELTEEVGEYDGVPMPARRTFTQTHVLHSGQEVVFSRQEMTVDELRVNPRLPPETFRIAYPAGTKVMPADGPTYVVGE